MWLSAFCSRRSLRKLQEDRRGPEGHENGRVPAFKASEPRNNSCGAIYIPKRSTMYLLIILLWKVPLWQVECWIERLPNDHDLMDVSDWCGPLNCLDKQSIRFHSLLMPSLPPDALSFPLTLSGSVMKTMASTAVVSGVNMESKIGVMVAILLTSLFGVCCPIYSQKPRITRFFLSCIVSSHIDRNTFLAHPSYRLLHWKTLWNGCHTRHCVHPFTGRGFSVFTKPCYWI